MIDISEDCHFRERDWRSYEVREGDDETDDGWMDERERKELHKGDPCWILFSSFSFSVFLG